MDRKTISLGYTLKHFDLFQGERFEDTKLRLQSRLGIADKDFAKFRFALMQSHQYKLPSPLTDGESNNPD